MKIFLDIETIPTQDVRIQQHIRDNIKPPGTYKKQESIDTWLAENRERAAEDEVRKTSFDGAYGQICCISCAINHHPPKTFWVADYVTGERSILFQFFNYIEKNYDPSRMVPPVFIGHNLTDFDLRFIYQRAVILGVNPPRCIPLHATAWDKNIFDTMARWAGRGNRVSLDKLCQSLNLPLKGDEIGEPIDGSKVWDFVKAGKIEQVAKYCSGDVERVRAVYQRMTFDQSRKQTVKKIVETIHHQNH